MTQVEKESTNKKLIEFILSFPFPYADILREQITAFSVSNIQYPDCYTIVFDRTEEVRQLPLWLPAMPQGCQVIKESGPISCHLYVESGFVVQFEVVDMGMNEIDWEYFWGHKPIFDVEYDSTTICNYLTVEEVKISRVYVGHRHVHFAVDTSSGHHTVSLWDCDIQTLQIPDNEFYCHIEIYCLNKGNLRYLLKSDDNSIVIECSMLCLQDGLIIK